MIKVVDDGTLVRWMAIFNASRDQLIIIKECISYPITSFNNHTLELTSLASHN